MQLKYPIVQYSLEYLEELPEHAEKKIEQGHMDDEAAEGIVCNYKRFSLIAKDQKGDIIGTLIAYTAFSEVYVDDIWVVPSYRKHGIGKRLLQDLEGRFANKGYNNINLVTSEFTNAKAFYKKCGFELEFVRINKHNTKLTKYFFIKYFDDENQYHGILTK